MSYQEALSDGIKIGKDSKGFNVYYPPCHICGESVQSWGYSSQKTYTCKECKVIRNELRKEELSDLRKVDKESKLNEALVRISKVSDIIKYESAIDRVRKHLGKANWFESTEEIMVALELIRHGIRAHHQVKVLKFRVDFVLPDEKIILEIDGKPFHGADRKSYEQERDQAIISMFGDEWDVIRISTDHINKNVTRLIQAVKAVKKSRQKYRASFNGKLPKWYSDTAVRKR